MNTTLPAVISGLIVNVYDDVVAKEFPGLERSNASKRDRSRLREVTSTDALSALSRCGKDLDGALAKGQEDIWAATPLVIPEIHASDFLAGVKKQFSVNPAGVVRCCRQVLNLLAKADVATPDVTSEITDFVSRQQEVAKVSVDWKSLRAVGCILLQHLDLDDIIPSHGNGAVATHEKPWEKMKFRRMYRAMQEFYPADRFFFLSPSHLSDSLGSDWSTRGLPLNEESEQWARLCAVPKDFRGRRIISCEPLEAMWIQQGQFRAMTHHLESQPLTRGVINFSSQDVNRRLALKSSSDAEYVTLDLKDASDRVSLSVFSEVFPKPQRERLLATRSIGTVLPDGTRVPLACFAPMGSACCFPVESVVFYAIVMAAIHDKLRPLKLPTAKWLMEHKGDVYVYGDDIIVRTAYAECAMDALRRCGFVLNPLKCCVGPRFRESCGQDAYAGKDVTPFRLKHLPDRRSAGSLPGVCDYLNRLRSLGFMRAFELLLKVAEDEFGTLPRTSYPGDLGILESRVEALWFNHDHFRSRWNKGLQRTEFLMPSIRTRLMPLETNCWSELFHCVLSVGSSQTGYAIPHRIQLMKRWRSC